MHLVANHPALYDGVTAFSGNYSTLDELGYQSVRGTVEGRGGELENMWGPRGSERWQENDTIPHPDGLLDTAVYFSAGNTATRQSARGPVCIPGAGPFVHLSGSVPQAACRSRRRSR